MRIPFLKSGTAAAIACATIATTVISGCSSAPTYSPREGEGRMDASHGAPAEGGLVGSVMPFPRAELCDNGVDDDMNGRVDENCPCHEGSVQRCYGGDPRFAGVGACRLGVQHCVQHLWDVCSDWVPPSTETPNGFDDNCDGRVDDGFSCTPNATQTCFRGSPLDLGVGICHAGTQTCSMATGDPEFPSQWGPCVGDQEPEDEVCNGIDDDCNGVIDNRPEFCNGIDDNCNGVVDEGCPVPATGVPTFYRSDPSLLSEGVYTSNQVSLLLLGTSTGPCAPPNVFVELTSGSLVCVPPPPMNFCPPGTELDYAHGAWVCVPCRLIVQFGGLFGGRRVCTENEPPECWPGTVATFDADTLMWVCTPPCDNGAYDLMYFGAASICIPC